MANEYKIPTTPIGARTGLSGGALSIHEGIGLSIERLNKIIKIDEQNLQVLVEPAVITEVLRETVSEKDYFILQIQVVKEVLDWRKCCRKCWWCKSC